MRCSCTLRKSKWVRGRERPRKTRLNVWFSIFHVPQCVFFFSRQFVCIPSCSHIFLVLDSLALYLSIPSLHSLFFTVTAGSLFLYSHHGSLYTFYNQHCITSYRSLVIRLFPRPYHRRSPFFFVLAPMPFGSWFIRNVNIPNTQIIYQNVTHTEDRADHIERI